MLDRLKKIRNLSKLSDPVLERLQSLQEAIENHHRSNGGELLDLTKEGFEWAGYLSPMLQDPGVEMIQVYPGKGEFLPDMTDQEVLEYERNERLGWKKLKLPWQKD